jgi:hypothetical protein
VEAAIVTPNLDSAPEGNFGGLVRQQSWQEIVDESSIRKRSGESFRPRVMQ